MPREVFHWNVLHQAVEKIGTDSPVAKVVKSSPYLAEIGAVAHDATYYLEGGRSSLTCIGNALHGSRPGDPLEPLVECIRYVYEKDDVQLRGHLWAFLLGMLSHSVTDSILHPFVFYFTGDYHDPDSLKRRLAQQRHRVLEVYLDMWVLEPGSSWGSMKLSTRLAKSVAQQAEIEMMFEKALIPGIRRAFPTMAQDLIAEYDTQNASSVYQGILDMAFYQKLFFSPLVGCISWVLGKLAPNTFGPLEGLFLFGRSGEGKRVLDSKFSYLNPVSAEPVECGIADLQHAAIVKTAQVFEAMQSAVSGQSLELESLRELLSGVSLDFGIRNVAQGSATHFDTKGINLPDLRL